MAVGDSGRLGGGVIDKCGKGVTVLQGACHASIFLGVAN